MKSVIYILIALILVVPLVGCGEKEDPKEQIFSRDTMSDVPVDEMPEDNKGGTATQEEPK